MSYSGEQESLVGAMPETGLIGRWERAEKVVWEAKSRLNEKARKIFDDKASVSTRLEELGLLPTIPNKERPEIKILKGILIDKDGRELEVTAGDYGVSFGDLADPTRRDVQIDSDTIDLISKSGRIYIDQIGRSPFKGGAVDRTQDGRRYREYISKEEKYAHLKGDLNRDVLDAAVDGLALILDPETKLKSA